MRSPACPTSLCALLCLAIAAGCNQPADTTDQPSRPSPAPAADGAAADHHDVPMTQDEKDALKAQITSYEVAVDRIKSYRDTIRDRIAEGKPAEAHRSLDELDLVLEWLPATAKDSNIPKEHWETITTSGQTLRDSFNEVHAQIDEGKEPDYEAVEETVDEAVSALEAVPTT